MNGETRRKAWEWLALLFVLGAATGGVFGYSFAHRSYAPNNANVQTLSEPERRAQRVAEMTKEIGLTTEQSQKVDAVIAAAHDEMKTIHDKAEGDVDGVRQKARAQMREFLTAEQKPKFEEFVRRMDPERKKQEAKKKSEVGSKKLEVRRWAVSRRAERRKDLRTDQIGHREERKADPSTTGCQRRSPPVGMTNKRDRAARPGCSKCRR